MAVAWLNRASCRSEGVTLPLSRSRVPMRLRVWRWTWTMASSSSPVRRPRRTSMVPRRSSMRTWFESQPTISPFSKKTLTNSWIWDSTRLPFFPWILIMLNRENRSKSRREPSNAMSGPPQDQLQPGAEIEETHQHRPQCQPGGGGVRQDLAGVPDGSSRGEDHAHRETEGQEFNDPFPRLPQEGEITTREQDDEALVDPTGGLLVLRYLVEFLAPALRVQAVPQHKQVVALR